MKKFILILAVINFFSSCNSNSKKVDKDETLFERNVSISNDSIKSIENSIIGNWKVKKIMYRENGYDSLDGSARLRFICELYCGKQVDSAMFTFLPNHHFKVNEDKEGKWKINDDGRLIIYGDHIYLEHFPVFSDVPLFLGEDKYYKYLTANFKSEIVGIGHKVTYCLNRVTTESD